MTSSGVLHVHKLKRSNGISWKYDNNRTYYRSDSLLKLKMIIEELNLPWIVKDDDVYEKVISDELEDVDVNVLDFDRKMS